MKDKIKKFKYGSIILIVAILVSIPLFWKNYNYYNDDGIQHIVRAYLTEQNMKNGQSTFVLPQLENGFGYSWDLFYGPLSSASIAIVGMIFSNIILGYKFILFLGLLFSGISMYYLVKNITADKNVGVLASVLYMIMPYHLTDMYIRGSIGEFLSFIFIPLVFLGLYRLFNEQKRDWMLVIGAVGLIITHNLMTFIVAFISLIYVAVNLPKFKNKNIREKFFYNVIFIIFISSFFWVPMLHTSISTRYQVYESNAMASKESVQEHGINLKQLFITYTNTGDYVFELTPYILIMLCFTVAVFRRLTPEVKSEYMFFGIIGIISTFMATKYFPWKLLGDKVSLIQFPWRMMEISVFCFSIISAINMGIIIRKFNYKDTIVLCIIAMVYTVALNGFVPVTEDVLQNVEDKDFGFVTGRNTDCIAGIGKNEYLPTSAYNNYFYLATREQDIVVLEGTVEINNYEKNGNVLSAEIKVLDDKNLIELPYVYYPGYKVTLDGSEISSFEDKNGFLAIACTKMDNTDLKVEYVGNSAMNFSKIFSVLSLIIFGVYIIVNKNY